MIHGKYLGQGADLADVKKIRNAVFGGSGYDTHEELDAMAVNVIADCDEENISANTEKNDRNSDNDDRMQKVDSEKILLTNKGCSIENGKCCEKYNVAAGRLVLDLENDRFYVDNICVLEEFRAKKYGEFVLRMLADKASQCRAEFIWADVSGSDAKGFFEKMLFEEYEGDLMRAEIKKFQGCCHGC